jgi:site-specific DNA-cytosine methylase
MNNEIIPYLSGWASATVGMEYAKDQGFECAVLSEYDHERLEWACDKNPHAIPICGDFTDQLVFKTLVRLFREKECELAIFSPNCQPFSKAGCQHLNDPEAFYILSILDFICEAKPKWAWIENAKEFFNTVLADDPRTVKQRIIDTLTPLGYDVNCDIQDACMYGDPLTPQHRRRSICLISRVGGRWNFPDPEMDPTKWAATFNTIDFLPRIDAKPYGRNFSNIPYHFREPMPQCQIDAIRHLQEGENNPFAPNKNGSVPSKPRPPHAFRRIWKHRPVNTIMQKSASPSGYQTLHYCDNATLSISEITLLTGLPLNWNIPIKFRYKFQVIRDVLGECMAPRYCEALLKELRKIIPVK